MIHQVKASKPDVDKLADLLALQHSLLQLASVQASVTETDIAHHLAERYQAQAVNAATWLWHHPKLMAELNKFAAHADRAAKQALVDNIFADIDLLLSPRPQQLHTSFKLVDRPMGTADPPWKCGAGFFYQRFYELWKKGFPAFLFVSAACHAKPYSRREFIDGFLTANDGLYLCAICDAAAFRTNTNGNVYTSIEHFFPQSIYPHLAIHPYNLIPICTNCNTIKKDADLMELCSAGAGIAELLLPYQSQQPGLREMAYIEVRPRVDCGSDATPPLNVVHPLEIKLKPASVFQNSERLIEHFRTLYSVEQRWNNELEQIDEQVFRRIQQFLLVDVQMGNDLSDVNFLIDRLKLLMALTSKENLGKDPFGMATVWMIRHHIEMLRRADTSLHLLHQNLQTWAKSYQRNWTALWEHVAEIEQRVPAAAPLSSLQKTGDSTS